MDSKKRNTQKRGSKIGYHSQPSSEASQMGVSHLEEEEVNQLGRSDIELKALDDSSQILKPTFKSNQTNYDHVQYMCLRSFTKLPPITTTDSHIVPNLGHRSFTIQKTKCSLGDDATTRNLHTGKVKTKKKHKKMNQNQSLSPDCC